MRHRANRSEESAKQDETHYEKPHYKYRLLHGVVVVGDDETESTKSQCHQHGEQIAKQNVALAGDSVDCPCEDEADGDHYESNQPVGNEFGKDERRSADGRYVDGFDGASLFLANDVQCR